MKKKKKKKTTTTTKQRGRKENVRRIEKICPFHHVCLVKMMEK